MPYHFRDFSTVPNNLIFSWWLTVLATLTLLIPAGLIWLLLSLIRHKRLRLPLPQTWNAGVALSTTLLPLLSGLLPLAGLYLLAWRAQHNIGHWPMVTIDDPNNFEFKDPWYDRVDDLFWITWGAGGCCILLWLTLVVRFFGRMPKLLLIITPILFLLSWIIFVHEPGQRFSWWID